MQHNMHATSKIAPPHMTLPGYITPFERFTNRRLDLSHLRVFGSHVTVKQLHICLSKLETIYTTIRQSSVTPQRIAPYSMTKPLPTRLNLPITPCLTNPTVLLKTAPPPFPYAQQLMDIAEEHLVNPTKITTPAAPSPSTCYTRQLFISHATGSNYS